MAPARGGDAVADAAIVVRVDLFRVDDAERLLGREASMPIDRGETDGQN